MSDVETRILARTMITDACWLWLGSKCTKGYGEISVDNASRLVHRAMYEAHHGSIPDGLVIDHTCHDPKVCVGGTCVHRLCVNPDHLTVVTNEENLKRQSPAFKTECAHGHPFTDENTGRSRDGRRYCKVCYRESARRHQERVERGEVIAPLVRQWARENGLPVAERGQIKKSLIDAWRQRAAA